MESNMSLMNVFLSVRVDQATKQRIDLMTEATTMNQSEVIRTAVKMLFESSDKFEEMR